MRNEDTLKEVDRRFQDQREFFNAKFTHLSAVIQNGFESAEKERAEIIKCQQITNSRVNCLEDVTRPFNKKNRKYSIIGLVACMMIIGLTMAFAHSSVDAKQTITNKTGVAFKVDSLTTNR